MITRGFRRLSEDAALIWGLPGMLLSDWLSAGALIRVTSGLGHVGEMLLSDWLSTLSTRYTTEFCCFFCSCNLGKDQVRVFKKSAVDITRLIKRALDVDVSLYSSSELFICTAIFSLRRLKRFEKITEMMQ